MENETYTLDATDLQILRVLQQNCRISNKELAAKIHLSTSPTFERQKRLERAGIIRQYAAIIDNERVNRSFTVFCNVSFSHINHEKTMQFKEKVEEWNEVTECYNVSGDCDFVMKVCVASMRQYQEFVLYKVGELDYIDRIQSVFVMDTLKRKYGALPL